MKKAIMWASLGLLLSVFAAAPAMAQLKDVKTTVPRNSVFILGG